MIKYNLNTINDWNFGDDNINKVYYDNAVCYYKVISSGGTTAQTPCFAVVDNISQYQETEFEDVYDKTTEKWYKLNNLNQYEEYGLYGSSLTITTYEGKLTVDSGNEYIYSGGSWVYVGEVSGGTAQLPDVPFTVNYNAKNYDSSTKTLAKTSGQLADVDAVITAGTPTVNDGYLTIDDYSTRATISGYQTYFNRNNNNPNLTIISKQNTKSTGSNGCHLFANRGSSYNWMYRAYSNKLTLHGSGEQGSVAVTTQPVIESVRIDSNRTATYNNYTDNTSSTYNNFNYGSANSQGTALFSGYYSTTGEHFNGDFYWIYMSQSTLTDEQVQQVIDYNEGNGGGETIYPLEYTVKSDPPDNVTFSSMTEAEEYECPWWGMSADIDNTDFLFCETNEWLTKYSYQEVSGDYICDGGNKYKKMQEYDRNVDGSLSATTNYIAGDLIESGSTDCQHPSRLPSGYTEVEYVENTGSSSVNLNLELYSAVGNTFEIDTDNEMIYNSGGGSYQTLITSMSEAGEPYAGFVYRFHYDNSFEFSSHPTNLTTCNRTLVSGSTYNAVISCNGVTYGYSHNYPLNLFSSLDSYKNPFRYCKGKIYNMTVTLNGILERDLVPCRRDADSKYGLYDIVNNVFYSSVTNSELSGGDEV